MYENVEKSSVLEEMNTGAEMYVVDFSTRRVLDCGEMLISAVRSFIDKDEAMFFKKVENIG